jgi:predicted secreted protein
MSITSALVLLAVVWFMVLFVVLPLRLTTQGESGDVVPGTPKSAPTDARLGRKLRLVTLVSVPLWAAICAVILSGVIAVEDFDLFSRFGPDARPAVPAEETDG